MKDMSGIKAEAERVYSDLDFGLRWPLSLILSSARVRRIFVTAYTIGYCDGADDGIHLLTKPTQDLIEAHKNLSRMNADGAN